jgi:hypothetical protein
MVDGMKQTEEKPPETAHGPVAKAGFPYTHPEAASGLGSRLAELELENRRLNRLVAELMIKNQQLRDR